MQLLTMAVHVRSSAEAAQHASTSASSQRQVNGVLGSSAGSEALHARDQAVFLYTLKPGCATSSFAVRTLVRIAPWWRMRSRGSVCAMYVEFSALVHAGAFARVRLRRHQSFRLCTCGVFWKLFRM